MMEKSAGSWEKFSEVLGKTPAGNNGNIGEGLFDLPHEKTCFQGFRTGPMQTSLYSHRRGIVLSMVLIGCRQLICAFVFAYAISGFLMTQLIFYIYHMTSLLFSG